MGAGSSNYSEWNIDDKWSLQVWKSGEMSNTSTERPACDKYVIDDDMDSDTATESNLEPFSEITIILEQSKRSIAKDVGPFSRRCNARHGETFYDMGNVYVFDIGSICIHGKGLLRQFAFHQNTGKIEL